MSPRFTRICLVLGLTAIVFLLFSFHWRMWRQPTPPSLPLAFVRSAVRKAAATQNLSATNLLSVSSYGVHQLNLNVTEPPLYQDPKFLGRCAHSDKRHRAFHALKFWMKVAAEHNITWFLSCASNLGSLRHQDIIPWDHDVDLGVFETDEPIIRRLAVKRRRDMTGDGPHIVTRPAAFCPVYKYPRLNCKDETVMSQVDHCAFCGPMGRVLYKNVFMDLYMLQQRDGNTETVFRDQSFNAQTQEQMLPISTYFPLRLCKFMGLSVPCANKKEQYAKALYVDLRPLKTCVGSSWVKRKT